MQNESDSLCSNAASLVLVIEDVGKLSCGRNSKGRTDHNCGNAAGNNIADRDHECEGLVRRKDKPLRTSIDCLFDDCDLPVHVVFAGGSIPINREAGLASR